MSGTELTFWDERRDTVRMARRCRPFTSVGHKINNLLVEAGWNDGEACEAAKISWKTLNEWKRDPLRRPTFGQMIKFSKAMSDRLGRVIHPSQIFTGIWPADEGSDDPTDTPFLSEDNNVWQMMCEWTLAPVRILSRPAVTLFNYTRELA